MKRKIIILMGIALCTMLLISPALASGVDTLEIYGNANEDDTIDMRDLTYVKLIFFGKKPETELADAKYDGKINPLDFIQIKLIIVGKEKELTLIDPMERTVTVKKPIKSIITTKVAVVEMVRSVGAKDKLIGMMHYKTNRYPRYFGDLYHLPSIGSHDCESILSLNPDIALMDTYKSFDPCCDALEAAGIPVYRISGHPLYPPGATEDDYVCDIVKLGYIFDTEKEAGEFSDWFYDFMNKIKDRVSRLSDDEKPRGYFEYHRDYSTSGTGSAYMYCFEYAGVKNIFSDAPVVKGPVGFKPDPEAVIQSDPEIIATCRGEVCNYEIDDPSEAKAQREAIMNRPEFDHVTAVKNGKVYILPASFMPIYGGAPCHFFIGIAYMAKLFHPELFEDLDPEAIHQEYLTRFQRIDYDLDEWGVFVYPPFED